VGWEKGEGNAGKLPRAKATATYKRNKPDQKLHTAKALSIQYMAGFLACNIFAALPIRCLTDSGHDWQKLFFVTYSCATARDLHTIPY